MSYQLLETAVVTAGVAWALFSAARMAWQRLQPKGRGPQADCAPACGGGACAGCGTAGPASTRTATAAPVQWHPRAPKRG